jgi:uncharacterized protein
MFNADDILGRSIAFPLRLNDRNRLALVSADDAIRQSIYMIVHTVPGERLMRPDFGCRIHELIFDPANKQTAIVAERFVRDALERWEPRIDLDQVNVEASDGELGELVINIIYRLKNFPDPRSMVFPFYLNPDVLNVANDS